MTTLLSGIVGSTAYGMAGPDSDVDRLGVFAVPTVELFGLHPIKESPVTTKPDVTMHEAGKFCRLALGCNPTIMELLWLPQHLYETRSVLGDDLITIRHAFLSAKRVRDAYFGYATSQFHRLKKRDDGSFSADTRKRTAKHARHLARLLFQGLSLYQGGHLPIAVADPQWYFDFGERVAAGDLSEAEGLMDSFSESFSEKPSVLPDKPNTAVVEHWLCLVRRRHLDEWDIA